ncbi:2-hydroxyacyl-CoA dehydratase, partial [Candidatus Acetothermia bacterium]|nr:2-hydroxyacyl-CoA dehydratase [Candidatus Acetothermia bacterium]
RDIEQIAGHSISEEDLRKSIALYNENRSLLRELYNLRKESPWLLSASESFVIVKAGTILPKEEHNQLLREILSLLPERNAKPQDKVRVVFVGAFCELPPIEMIETMEEMCYVVDDDFLIGLRWLTEDVSCEGDPLWNLAAAYIEHSTWASTQYDCHKPKEKMLECQVRAARAQGAICAAAKFCEPGVDDQIAYAKHFDSAGVSYILVEFEEKQTSFERLKMQTETFAEAILFE